MNQDNSDICEIHHAHPNSVKKAKLHELDDTTCMRLAEIFKLLGDPTRIRILALLSSSELCVCDIAEALGMGQSAISHQLRLLRATRLVKFRKEGKEAFYSLDDDHVVKLMHQGLEHVTHG